jgi:hypothetical protein
VICDLPMWTAGVLQTANRNVFGQPHRALEHKRNRPVLRWPGSFASCARNLTGQALACGGPRDGGTGFPTRKKSCSYERAGRPGNCSQTDRFNQVPLGVYQPIEPGTLGGSVNGTAHREWSRTYHPFRRLQSGSSVLWSGSWNCATQLQIRDAHG